ncbi:MAG: PAS domain-containing protein [Actinomycetota bacterium]|nr:PAS domain-containing protein [Actinomycetota bacterium]
MARSSRPFAAACRSPPYLGLHRHRDGTELPVEVTATPALDADGAVTGMVIALRDLRLEVPERELEGSQSLGQLVGAAGALAFQLDQRVSPPAWFLCGDRSLIGLEGKSQTMTPLVANASTEPVRATLEALVAEVLGDRPGGSRVSTVIPPGRTQRWLAARAVVAEGAPSAPLRVCGVLVDVTDQYMSSEGERQEVPAAPTFVARISLGAERRLEYVSGSAYHFTGYAPQELLEGGLERLRGCLDRSLLERFEQERENGAIDGGSYDRTSGAGRHLGGASDAEVLVTTLMEVAAPGIV